jgi:hypothetical protein
MTQTMDEPWGLRLPGHGIPDASVSGSRLRFSWE